MPSDKTDARHDIDLPSHTIATILSVMLTMVDGDKGKLNLFGRHNTGKHAIRACEVDGTSSRGNKSVRKDNRGIQ